MKEISKRAQMQDVLQQLGYADGEGLAVVGDRKSRTTGPTPDKASVIKMLLDTFDERLKSVGLTLTSACVSWVTDESAEHVHRKLRQQQLIPEKSGLKQFDSLS
jgi:hypothetical protein